MSMRPRFWHNPNIVSLIVYQCASYHFPLKQLVSSFNASFFPFMSKCLKCGWCFTPICIPCSWNTSSSLHTKPSCQISRGGSHMSTSSDFIFAQETRKPSPNGYGRVNPTWMVETVAKHHGCMVNNHDNPPWIHIYIYIYFRSKT